ncbi:hypothetical protein [Marinibacterium profundimaris]|uniref:hypothetical protein n=1 Tax=Marinibacterium profundimaris TaxID=1679460 RepID=UPI00117D4862|nr:hypothetical protein [Marinibacterium profundimaris]
MSIGAPPNLNNCQPLPPPDLPGSGHLAGVSAPALSNTGIHATPAGADEAAGLPQSHHRTSPAAEFTGQEEVHTMRFVKLALYLGSAALMIALLIKGAATLAAWITSAPTP